MSQGAQASSRKAGGIPNPLERAARAERPTPKGGRRGTGDQETGTVTTEERGPTGETVRVAVNRPIEGQPYSASRAPTTPDLGAADSETGACGSEEGRVQ